MRSEQVISCDIDHPNDLTIPLLDRKHFRIISDAVTPSLPRGFSCLAYSIPSMRTSSMHSLILSIIPSLCCLLYIA